MSDASVEAPIKRDPVVMSITFRDVADAFAAGLRDFQAKPFLGLAFGGFFAAGGIAIVLFVTRLEMTYFAYPLAAGFALVGPFVALGLYELSRRREIGAPISLVSLLRTAWSRKEIAWMAFVTLFVFIMWMYQVRLLMALFLGFSASFSSLGAFFTTVITTTEGLMFLAVGNVIGAALSMILFSLTVVSFPILLDRDVDFVTAMITSVRAVAANPATMMMWALFIVVTMIVSILPMFLGLLVTLPVLGHTTWHLYRKLVAPEPA